MISSLMFIWLRSTLPQFASYLSSFQTDPSWSNDQAGNQTFKGDDYFIHELSPRFHNF